MHTPAIAIEQVGAYRVVRRLGLGGLPDVLLARSADASGIQRAVVLKLFPLRDERDGSFDEALAREASSYAAIGAHPAIVQLYDVVTLDSGLAMVVEYVNGVSLRRARDRLSKVGCALDDTAAIHIAAQVFSALAAAHAATGGRAPLIHGSVCPSSVQIAWDGQVKLGDFASATGLSLAITAEQASGTTLTPREGDVHAAGVLLWELLARRSAVSGMDEDTRTHGPRTEPRLEPLDAVRPDLDVRVREIVRGTLDSRPGVRHVSAEEVESALRQLVSEDEGRCHVADAMSMIQKEENLSSSDRSRPSSRKSRVSEATAPRGAPATPHATSGTRMRAAKVPAKGAPRLKRTASGEILAARPLLDVGTKKARTVPDPTADRKTLPPSAESSDHARRDPTSFPSLPRMLVVEVGGSAPSDARVPENAEPAVVGNADDRELSITTTASIVEPPPRDAAVDAEVLPIDVVHVSVAEELPVECAAAPPESPVETVRPRRSRWRMGALILVVMVGGLIALDRRGYVCLPHRVQVLSRLDEWKSAAEWTRALFPPLKREMPSAATSSPIAAPPDARRASLPPASAANTPEPRVVPPQTGLLRTADLPPRRRIFIDELTVGETPDTVTVKCGAHSVKIGSTGQSRMIMVPCGGEVTVDEH